MTENPSVIINQSVAILIDGNNIEMSLHHLVNQKNALLDFDKLVPKLLVNRGLSRLIYFREGKSISTKLAERLLKNFHGSVIPCHKSADIPLTINATQIARKVDTIIILSGDSDYVELVRHLKGEGVRVEIAAVAETTARILIDEADHFTPIEEEDCFILKTFKPKKTITQPVAKQTSKPTSKPRSKQSSKPRPKPTAKPRPKPRSKSNSRKKRS